jgi:hypothetical protein
MKNIHVLPTDKASKLVLNNQKELWFNPDFSCKSGLAHPQNIYITNNEEIKEGDWGFDGLHIFKCLKPFIANETTSGKNIPCFHIELDGKSNTFHETSYIKKIILTTDQDLINDGVQSIDDEFLEWFVKNPSCESIKVIHKFDEDWSEESGAFEIDYYKIIIPQEEKQETLEEAAKNHYYRKLHISEEQYELFDYAFGEGAKWQAERIPSIIEEYLETAFISKEQGYMNPKKWFEQFKKK